MEHGHATLDNELLGWFICLSVCLSVCGYDRDLVLPGRYTKTSTRSCSAKAEDTSAQPDDTAIGGLDLDKAVQ